MEIELVKFSKISTNGLNKIGKLGLVLTFKNNNEFQLVSKYVKRNFYSTVENVFTPSKNITHYFYYIVDKLLKILIPRFLLQSILNVFANLEITYKIDIPDVIYSIPEGGITNIINEPWDNKKDIIQYIQTQFNDPFKSGLILDIPTGAGKTVMLSYLTKYYVDLGYKVHIIVTGIGLIKQTLDEFDNKKYIRILGGKSKKGIKKFDHKEDKSNFRILISTIQSLAVYIKNSIDIYDYFDDFYLTCIDEPQLITTVNRHKALKLVQTKLMLGLSASADNSIFIKEYIGPIYKPLGFTSVKFDIVVIKLNYSGPDEFCQNKKRWFAELGEEKNCAMQTNLLIETDPYRNSLICIKITELLNDGHPCVLVLSKNLGHINTLYDMLSNKKELQPIKWTGSRTDADVEYAINIANIILATYDSFGTGTNIPKITTMIYSTSYRDDKKQIQFFGRALRPDVRYNHIKRIIYDIVDINVFLANHFNTRKKVFKSKNVPIIIQNVDYKEIELVK
jgi:hypothetical protein